MQGSFIPPKMKTSQRKNVIEVERKSSRQATVEWTVQSKDRWTLVSVEDLDQDLSGELELFVEVGSRRVLQPFTRLDQAANKLKVVVSGETSTETTYFSNNSQMPVFVSGKGNCLSLPLPLALIPGHRYRVKVTLLQGEHACDANLIRCQLSEKPLVTEFRAELTKSELKQLHEKADNFTRRPTSWGGSEFSQCTWFYRNKTPAYYHNIFTQHGGLMIPYLKDNNGDPGCPINRRLDGLFFGVSVVRGTGNLPSVSPFGSRRLCIDWRWMFTSAPNLYFADFYCNTKPHYVTLVMTKNWSKSDIFCRRHLLGPLETHANPFLRLTPKGQCAMVNANVTVEVFFTENVNISQLVYAGLATFVDTLSTGTSRPEGIPKRQDCTVCNL